MDDFAKAMIVDRQCYFASHDKFNDPFDCRVRFSSECTIDEFREFIRTREIERKVHLPSAYEARHETLKNSLPELRAHVAETGVFCLAARRDHPLMWAHYANRHAGICLEFNTRIGGENRLFHERQLWRVEYSKETPVFEAYRASLDDLARKSLFRKSLAWRYEQEWRVIGRGKANTSCQYTEGGLNAVILGAKISNRDRQQVEGWLDGLRPKPRLLQAELRDRTYRIYIVEAS